MVNKMGQETGHLKKLIVEALQEKKAHDIVNLNLEKIPNAVTHNFIICHGSSRTQVDALAAGVLEWVKKETGEIPFNKEGFENSEWILIDYVDVVVHIFREETRLFYQLEDLWADALVEKFPG